MFTYSVPLIECYLKTSLSTTHHVFQKMFRSISLCTSPWSCTCTCPVFLSVPLSLSLSLYPLLLIPVFVLLSLTPPRLPLLYLVLLDSLWQPPQLLWFYWVQLNSSLLCPTHYYILQPTWLKSSPPQFYGWQLSVMEEVSQVFTATIFKVELLT